MELFEPEEVAMGWEIYKPERTITDGPSVTVSNLGRVSFNRTAAKTLRAQGKPKVLLLWDKETSSVGIRPTDVQEGTYALNPEATITLTFSCVSFLNYIGYDWTRTRSFPASWDKKQGMFVFQVPKEFLGASPRNRRSRIRIL